MCRVKTTTAAHKKRLQKEGAMQSMEQNHTHHMRPFKSSPGEPPKNPMQKDNAATHPNPV